MEDSVRKKCSNEAQTHPESRQEFEETSQWLRVVRGLKVKEGFMFMLIKENKSDNHCQQGLTLRPLPLLSWP